MLVVHDGSTAFSFAIDILQCAHEQGKKISTIPVDVNYEREMSTLSFTQQDMNMTGDLPGIFVKRLRGGHRG